MESKIELVVTVTAATEPHTGCEMWCLGMFRRVKDWGRLRKLIQLQILHRVKECLIILRGHLSESWSWTRSGPFSRLMSLSTQSKSTRESLRKKKWKVMEQPSQSPDWNPIEVLLGDLKQAVHARKPSNIMQVKEFYMGRSKMSPNQCQRLWGKYAKMPARSYFSWRGE